MREIISKLEGISIHAPRAGCDANAAKGFGKFAVFQSTHPVRGATTILGLDLRTRLFQSTHPVRGATRGCKKDVPRGAISIHAPRAGCDAED